MNQAFNRLIRTILPVYLVAANSSCTTFMSMKHWSEEKCPVIYSGIRDGGDGCLHLLKTYSTMAGIANIGSPIIYYTSFPFSLVMDTALLPVTVLYASGKDVYFYDYHKKRKIIGAARNGDLAAVRLALQSGNDVNVSDNYGTTALMEAVWHGHTEVVKLLIDAGADVNAKWNGRTLMWYARESGHGDIVELLKSAGAKR